MTPPRLARARVGTALTIATLLVAFSWSTSASAQDADVELPAAPANPAPTAPPATPPPAAPPATPTPTPAPTTASPTIEQLEARLRALEAKQAEATAPPPPAAPPLPADSNAVRVEREPSLVGGVTGPAGLIFSGYLQAQYESSQLSEDQLQQGGLPLNQNRFLVRRARLRVDRAWPWASTTIEIDGNTTRGPTFGLRRAEASLVWRNPDRERPPYLRFTAGLSEIPFGYEMTDSARSRWFMERSTGSLALFPGEPDLGVRLSGGVGFFRYAVAALNGEPIDDRPGRQSRDPNAAKELVARVGIDTKAHEKLRVSGGLSFLTGTGFHAGKDATKNGVIWRDLNENGSVDAGEITAVPGTAATPSQNFSRWAVGADLQLALETFLGRSRLYGEVFVAQNADRGYAVADPIASGADARELGFYVAYVQDITRWAVVGFRTDHYDPNSDVFDKRGGRLIPADTSVHVYSPLVGAVLFDRFRLLFQYDAIVDSLARDAQGVPTDLKNDQFTIRLQGEL